VPADAGRFLSRRRGWGRICFRNEDRNRHRAVAGRFEFAANAQADSQCFGFQVDDIAEQAYALVEVDERDAIRRIRDELRARGAAYDAERRDAAEP
jgi:hypothetical protein